MPLKRIYIASLMGVLAGIVCCYFATDGQPTAMKLMANIFTGRVLIGFVIGISALKMNWALHGALIGMIVSIPASFGAMMGASAQYGKWELFLMTLVMGIIYGIVIELFTSVFFKAKVA